MFKIESLNAQHKETSTNEFLSKIRANIANKTKPLGSLGQLEQVAEQLALIQSVSSEQFCQSIKINKPTCIVFAGDHGIAQHNISIAPSDVTRQMVLNFINGGAAINCFCRVNNIELLVVDAGIKQAISKEENGHSAHFISKRLGAGTGDITIEKAMSASQVQQGLLNGKHCAANVIANGCNLLMFGEMGIGNTSAASAIWMALSNNKADECVGRGTGITLDQFIEKQRLITQAVERFRAEESVVLHKQENRQENTLDPLAVLAQLGGFEIVQIVGAILVAAEAKIAILIDGFIVTSAALIAEKMHPEVKDYFIFSHQSNEHAHQAMLEYFQATPLLSLGLRLGEGTGGALALPLIQAAASFYNDMASFESAGVIV